jgi:DNA-binding XRE family transcriptional regulator
MKSEFSNILPSRLRRSLTKFGLDLSTARRKRHLTVEMLAERVGVSRTTYLKVEKGDPKVSMGIYAMALFVLGFPDALAQIADARQDDTGLLLEAERLPKRVRVKTEPSGL